jgi:hypothetical protein
VPRGGQEGGDPDTRRVIAQLLDYAAALWGLGLDEFEQRVLRSLRGETDSRPLAQFVADELVPAEIDDAGEATSQILDALSETLRSGEFALVLAAPTIPERVLSVIEYLNARRMSVFGLEVSYFGGEVEAFVPRIVARPTVGARIAGQEPCLLRRRSPVRIRLGVFRLPARGRLSPATANVRAAAAARRAFGSR